MPWLNPPSAPSGAPAPPGLPPSAPRSAPPPAIDAAPGAPGRSASGASSADASSSPTGLRITTGGIGRDPGMLMRIRVVSVVSVFGSPLPPLLDLPGRSARASASGSGPGAPRSGGPAGPSAEPYGPVPGGRRGHRARRTRRTNCQFHGSKQVLPVGFAALAIVRKRLSGAHHHTWGRRHRYADRWIGTRAGAPAALDAATARTFHGACPRAPAPRAT
ncbi:hypothetical protein D7M15_20090 [Streptomyces sp. Z26]|nr:hypothetical protein D7M15_20090 [Streptomyces sp. Z26]